MLPACAAAAAPTSAQGEKALHAWEGGDSPAALEAWVQDRLRRADADVARVLGAKGARSVANTLRPYDDAVNELLLAVSQSSVIYGVGATRELRDKAQSLTQTANAAYIYTYALDKVIALDFFAQFDARNLLGDPAGMRYRRAVLAPGSTRPAAELARDFLGREPNLDAYRRWMLAEFDAEAKASSAAR